MIHVKDIQPVDIGRKIIYRSDEGAGAAEYAVLVRSDHRRLYIQVQGDATITQAKPIECSWA